MGNSASVNPTKSIAKEREAQVQKDVEDFESSGTVLDDIDALSSREEKTTSQINPERYNFPFENLVFEGGGMKGAGYTGALRYLEEIGLENKIKRYAGTSAGAMLAALLAVGYKSDDISIFLEPKYITSILDDNPWGVCNLIPNMFRSYGWKPTTRLYTELGHHIQENTGDPDFTFKQVYKTFGKELCICVTNVNQMSAEFCHPKTTPDLPIRKAVCMSMSIPGYFQAFQVDKMGYSDVYVDGGMLCNFPIHCFDGWFLSMKPEDSFFEKLQPLSNLSRMYSPAERFGTFNEKTLGMQVYSEYEQDLMKTSLDSRCGALTPTKPSKNTKLYNTMVSKKIKQKHVEKMHARVVKAVDAFLTTIKKHNIDSKDSVDVMELQKVFEDKDCFTDKHCTVLFGRCITADEAFEIIDRNNDGEIEYSELIKFVQETGVCLQVCFNGYCRQEITDFKSFISRVQDSVMINLKRVYVKAADIERVVGINTGHIDTTDFSKMEDADLVFLEEVRAFQYHNVVMLRNNKTMISVELGFDRTIRAPYHVL